MPPDALVRLQIRHTHLLVDVLLAVEARGAFVRADSLALLDGLLQGTRGRGPDAEATRASLRAARETLATLRDD